MYIFIFQLCFDLFVVYLWTYLPRIFVLELSIDFSAVNNSNEHWKHRPSTHACVKWIGVGHTLLSNEFTQQPRSIIEFTECACFTANKTASGTALHASHTNEQLPHIRTFACHPYAKSCLLSIRIKTTKYLQPSTHSSIIASWFFAVVKPIQLRNESKYFHCLCSIYKNSRFFISI